MYDKYLTLDQDLFFHYLYGVFLEQNFLILMLLKLSNFYG
jgi:hypothetical protein